MISFWPSETPWPLAIICLVGAVVFLIAWAQQKRAAWLFGVFACILLGAGGWIYDFTVVTERERVTDSVIEIVQAFRNRDQDGTLALISASSPDLRQMAAWGVENVELGSDARLSDIHVEFTKSMPRARSSFRLNGTLTFSGVSQRFSSLWEAKWQLEDNGWRMIDLRQFDPVTGRPVSHVLEWRRAVQFR